jgi:hypothetical protein
VRIISCGCVGPHRANRSRLHRTCGRRQQLLPKRDAAER